MKPTKQQWSKWTLPSKASYISMIVGFIALALGLFSYLSTPFGSNHREESAVPETALPHENSININGNNPTSGGIFVAGNNNVIHQSANEIAAFFLNTHKSSNLKILFESNHSDLKIIESRYKNFLTQAFVPILELQEQSTEEYRDFYDTAIDAAVSHGDLSLSANILRELISRSRPPYKESERHVLSKLNRGMGAIMLESDVDDSIRYFSISEELQTDTATSIFLDILQLVFHTENTPTNSQPETQRVIKRKGGWIASIFPMDKSGEMEPSIGNLIINGFPMNHNIYQKKFNGYNEGIAYRGKGELKLRESGVHTLSISLESNMIPNLCRFTFELEEQVLFDIPKFADNKKEVYTNQIDIEEGIYMFEMLQACTNPHAIWNLQILSPSAMELISLGPDVLFHRVRQH